MRKVHSLLCDYQDFFDETSDRAAGEPVETSPEKFACAARKDDQIS